MTIAVFLMAIEYVFKTFVIC